MTTSRTFRCDHCRDVYTYHPSGFSSYSSPFNNNKYCPYCTEAILDMLKRIPKKFKKEWVLTCDYTKEQICAAQEERLKRGPPVRRISPGLFDLDNPNNKQECVMEELIDPVSNSEVYYSVSWWSDNPEKTRIVKEVWWDIENNCMSKDQKNYRS